MENNALKDNNIISHPSHYCFGKYGPINVIQDWKLDFCLGNVIKYVVRAGHKEDNSMIQDLEKAKQYLEFEIENLKEQEGYCAK